MPLLGVSGQPLFRAVSADGRQRRTCEIHTSRPGTGGNCLKSVRRSQRLSLAYAKGVGEEPNAEMVTAMRLSVLCGGVAAALMLAACQGDAPGGSETDALESASESSGGVALELEAELVFIEQGGPPNFRVAALGPGEVEPRTLFTLPSGAFAYGLAVHPTTGRILLAYSEPAEGDEPGFDRSVLVELDDDGPHYLLGDDAAGQWALHPEWSVDGDSVWYAARDGTVVIEDGDEPPTSVVRVSRRTGEVEVEIPWATEPAVSPDGENMAWVAIDPQTWSRDVVLGTIDGQVLRVLVDGDDVYDLGLPVFSPDGRGVFVSVLEDPDVVRSAMNPAALVTPPRVTGHGVHLLPADWYGIAIDGHELMPVSTLSTIHYDGSVASDAWHLVSATREGIELIDVVEGHAERLLSSRAVRAVAWRSAGLQ